MTKQLKKHFEDEEKKNIVKNHESGKFNLNTEHRKEKKNGHPSDSSFEQEGAHFN